MITGLTPSKFARGSDAVPVTVAGENFETGAQLADSSTGVTFSSIVVVSSTEITADVSVTQTAAKLETNVTVTNPDGIFRVCHSCLDVVASS
jgi:hypothetical protein